MNSLPRRSPRGCPVHVVVDLGDMVWVELEDGLKVDMRPIDRSVDEIMREPEMVAGTVKVPLAPGVKPYQIPRSRLPREEFVERYVKSVGVSVPTERSKKLVNKWVEMGDVAMRNARMSDSIVPGGGENRRFQVLCLQPGKLLGKQPKHGVVGGSDMDIGCMDVLKDVIISQDEELSAFRKSKEVYALPRV